MMHYPLSIYQLQLQYHFLQSPSTPFTIHHGAKRGASNLQRSFVLWQGFSYTAIKHSKLFFSGIFVLLFHFVPCYHTCASAVTYL